MSRRNTLVCIAACTWLSLLILSSCTGRSRDGYTPSYPGAQRVDASTMKIDDGDTFVIRGEHVRLLGVDTPETKSPEVGIHENQPYGPEATESTRVWIERAQVVEIVADGRGHYGRRLAHIIVDGELLGERLLAAGLAYENVSHFGDNGFPDLADRILDAAAAGPKPRFQQPYKWRRKNQKRR